MLELSDKLEQMHVGAYMVHIEDKIQKKWRGNYIPWKCMYPSTRGNRTAGNRIRVRCFLSRPENQLARSFISDFYSKRLATTHFSATFSNWTIHWLFTRASAAGQRCTRKSSRGASNREVAVDNETPGASTKAVDTSPSPFSSSWASCLACIYYSCLSSSRSSRTFCIVCSDLRLINMGVTAAAAPRPPSSELAHEIHWLRWCRCDVFLFLYPLPSTV